MTAAGLQDREVVLSVGDTTYLDYGSIKLKQEGYGPIGAGGNGLILHSALAVDPDSGCPLGLLWQKIWNRKPKEKSLKAFTPEEKKQRETKK